MAYDASDPRAALAPATATLPTGDDGIAAAEYFEFDQEPTEVSAGGSPSWHVRAQNVVLVLTRLAADDSLSRVGQEHEYAVILTDSLAHVEVTWGAESVSLAGVGLLVVPAGDSTVRAVTDCVVVRLFDIRSADLLDLPINKKSFAQPHPRVAHLVPWPDPVGERIRVYPLADVVAEPGRFGRIFRTSSFMINFLDDQPGPRDPEKLSPHHHDDFEQISLAVEGSWQHHIRTPWTPKRSRWVEDEHRTVGSPSVTIIPPPTVHTSEAKDAGMNRLIDIFSPPREDFSAKPGWVLNAEEYPTP
jgi:mannose-6-phosphate isomerase-like protein (cupin superfamily)